MVLVNLDRFGLFLIPDRQIQMELHYPIWVSSILYSLFSTYKSFFVNYEIREIYLFLETYTKGYNRISNSS